MKIRFQYFIVAILLLLLQLPFNASYGQAIDSSSVREINGKQYIFHTVVKGNTLYSLSRNYNVSVESIVKENPSAKGGLSIGQVLRIALPDRREEIKRKIELDGNYIVHEVTPKQTLYAISKMYNVDVKDIVAENQLVVYGIHKGDLLKIPIDKIKKEKAPIFDVTKDEYLDYLVKPKETLFSISQQFNVSVSDIKRVNKGLVGGLKEGQLINVPVNIVGFDKTDSSTPDSLSIKGRYNIALFLPLFIDMNDSLDSKRMPGEAEKIYGGKNTVAALKFYQGVKMALDSMGKQGFKATLYVYDTENNYAVVNEILQKPEFKEMDLIIGPLYPKLFNKVLDYAGNNNISIVSPINSSNRPLLGNDVLIKVVTSKTTQVANFAEYVAEYHRKKNIVVLKKDLSNDNLAKTFLTTYKESLVLINDTVFSAPASEFLCSGATKADQYKITLRKDTHNVVFIPSTDRVFVTDVIRKLNSLTKDYSITVVGMEEWLKYDNIDMDYFNHLNLHVISWNYIDYEKEETLNFAKAYHNKYKSFPREYASRSFDISYYIFTLMKQYGREFRNYIERKPMKMSSHSFRFCQTAIESGFENQSLVILKFKDYKLVQIN